MMTEPEKPKRVKRTIPTFQAFERACVEQPDADRIAVGRSIGMGEQQARAFAARLATSRGELPPLGEEGMRSH